MKIFIIALILLVGCKAPSHIVPMEDATIAAPLATSDLPTLNEVTEAYMVLLNDHRQTLGLNPYTYSHQIEEVALVHAQNMAQGNIVFGHTGFSSRCTEIRTALGKGNLCGEIIAQGQTSPQDVFNSWIKSTTHKPYLESTRYTHTGMGIAISSAGVVYWVQMFLEII